MPSETDLLSTIRDCPPHVLEYVERLEAALRDVVDCWGVGWRRHELHKMIAAMQPFIDVARAAIADRQPEGEG